MLLWVGILILFAADLGYTRPGYLLIETKDSDVKGKSPSSEHRRWGSYDYADDGGIGSFDYADDGGNGSQPLDDLLGGIKDNPILGAIKGLVGDNKKSLEESWKSLKTELRSYDFEPIITELQEQSKDGDLGKVIKAFDKEKIWGAIDIEGLGKLLGDYVQKNIGSKQMREILTLAHKIVQRVDIFNITDGLYPDKLVDGVKNTKEAWKGIDFVKLLSGIKMICNGIDYNKIFKGVEMKNLVGVMNPKEFSNKLGEKIVNLMEAIEGQKEMIKEIKKIESDTDPKALINQLTKHIDFKKLVKAVDTKLLLDGLNLKLLKLLPKVDIGKLTKIAGDVFNIVTKMMEKKKSSNAAKKSPAETVPDDEKDTSPPGYRPAEELSTAADAPAEEPPTEADDEETTKSGYEPDEAGV